MGCRSEHMAPTVREKELSRVAYLLDELAGVSPIGAGDGYHRRVYNRWSQELADELTAELCGKLQKCPDVTQHSLEMQIWWRDHQEADARRAAEEAALPVKQNFQALGDTLEALYRIKPHLCGVSIDEVRGVLDIVSEWQNQADELENKT